MASQLGHVYATNRTARRPFAKVVFSGLGSTPARSYIAPPPLGSEEVEEALRPPSIEQESDEEISLLNGMIGQHMEKKMQGNWRRWGGITLRPFGGLEHLHEDLTGLYGPESTDHQGRETAEIGSAVVENASYEPLTTKSQMVYLTADTETTLETLEEGTTYIIGGIVDRNRYKVRAPYADPARV